MQAGSLVVSLVTTPTATWSCLVLLLSVHLAMNHAAVKAVSLHSVNRQRANILFSAFWDQKRVMTPEEVSQQERIFEWDGVLRWRGSAPFAKARIGVSLQTLLSSLAPAHAVTSSTRDADAHFKTLFEVFGQNLYLLSYDTTKKVTLIVLKEGATPVSSFKAWAHALLLSHRLDETYATAAPKNDLQKLVQSTLEDITEIWDPFVQQLTTAGWDIDISNFETASGTRLRLDANSNNYSDNSRGI